MVFGMTATLDVIMVIPAHVTGSSIHAAMETNNTGRTLDLQE
jgi:hypothetical protein